MGAPPPARHWSGTHGLRFNAAVALAEFLFDTWQERQKSSGP
jgi:hypothetical protein